MSISANHLFKSRLYLISAFFGFLYVCQLAHLFIIQGLKHDYYHQLGQKQYAVTITSHAPRAVIFDRTGKQVLALNLDAFSAVILPHTLKETSGVHAFLEHNFPTAYQRLCTHSDTQFMYIKRKLSPEDLALIEQSNLTDIKIIHEPSRYYPLAAAAPLIGITDIDNKGISGIEFAFDQLLAGTPTIFALEKDARSKNTYFKKEITESGIAGQPIQLTIDGTLQFLVAQEVEKTVAHFNAQEGAALVMDPVSGDILAMVSVPGFNPNDTHNLCLSNTKNKVVTEAYELGSVFKVFTALAALQEQVTTPDELIDCKNSKTTFIDGRKINTVTAHGSIPFWQVVAQSNNIGSAIIAKRLGTKLYDHYAALGFGQKTALNFPGQNKGFLNKPEDWSKQSLISLSYGYEVSATLLQLALAFCVIAQDGFTVTPHLLLNPREPELPARQLYDQQPITIIKEILEKTTKEGTARKAAVRGYRVMSKTGTANMLVDGHYVEDKNLFTCAGIVEKGAYKRVIVTFIKQCEQPDLYASGVTAPLFERIATTTLIHEKII